MLTCVSSLYFLHPNALLLRCIESIFFFPEKSLVYHLILFSATSLLRIFVNLSFGGGVHLYFKESSPLWGHKYILQYFPAEDLRFYFYT